MNNPVYLLVALDTTGVEKWKKFEEIYYTGEGYSDG